MSARKYDEPQSGAARTPLGSGAIRTMTVTDIRAVVALERTLFSDPWPEVLFRDELKHVPRTYAVVFEEVGHIAGYALCTFVVDEAHLENLAVAREHWGGGVAQSLMDHVSSEALRRGARYMALEVRRSNARAIRFYERNGFRQVAMRRGYYRRPTEDAIVMILSYGAARRSEDDAT